MGFARGCQQKTDGKSLIDGVPQVEKNSLLAVKNKRKKPAGRLGTLASFTAINKNS